MPEKCKYIDQQVLKIQELPETLPTGEIPRSFMLYCERAHVNVLTPGSRITLCGILSVFESTFGSQSNFVKNSYLQAIGIRFDDEKQGNYTYNFTKEEEEKFELIAKNDSYFLTRCLRIRYKIDRKFHLRKR